MSNLNVYQWAEGMSKSTSYSFESFHEYIVDKINQKNNIQATKQIQWNLYYETREVLYVLPSSVLDFSRFQTRKIQ